MTSELVERLLAHILHHSNIAACSIRMGEPNLDAVMLSRAAAKALHYGLGYSSQDVLDYVEVYETMLELVSDTYPILPELQD